jgi:hypothetical protein
MHKKTKTILATAATAGALALGLAGCHVPGTNPATNDLRNSGTTYPNYSTTILNVDGFPNVTLLCFQGEAWVTTTRDYDSLTIDPKLESFCATKIGQQTK